jgi:holo-[acyl-carrier protein] synthase
MIYAVGTDLVEVSRIGKIIEKWNDRFLKKIFSKREIAYCEKRAYPYQHYAARFAVKEAFLKCLGLGITGGLKLKDIEVVNSKDGKPELKLHEEVRSTVKRRGVIASQISISHTDDYATAIVALEK